MQKYGWPFVLFVGVPFLALNAGNVYNAALESGLVSRHSFFFPGGLPGATTAVLLSILYPLMRKADQATLRLVWSCTLAVAAIGTLGNVGAEFSG